MCHQIVDTKLNALLLSLIFFFLFNYMWLQGFVHYFCVFWIWKKWICISKWMVLFIRIDQCYRECLSIWKGFLLQFQEGTRLPTTYAFALAEHRQGDLLRVRMWLDGEVKGINTDEVVSCPRLLSMHSLIGNLINDPNRGLYILKVSFSLRN